MAKKKARPKTKSPQASAGDSPGGDSSENEVNFEESLQQVEEIVGRLEGGQLGLTESLDQYEAGIRQLKQCQQMLDAAEQKVNLLSGFDADGNPVLDSLGGSADGGNRSATRKLKSSEPNSERSDQETDSDLGLF